MFSFPWIGWNPSFLGSFLAFLLTISYWRWSRSRFVRLINVLPGPKALPVLGNIHHLNIPHDELLEKSAFTWVRKYGGIYRLWHTVRPLVVIATPELMEPIYGSPRHISRGDAYDGFTAILGKSLLLAPDERWKKSRRILNPSFHVQVLNSYMDNFNERSLECAQSFEEAIKANNGEEFDIFPILNLCTLKTICETAMGHKSLPIEDMQSLLDNCIGFKRNYQYRLFRPWFKNDWLFHLTAMGRDNPKFVKGINNFSNTLIEHRRQFLDNERKAESQLPALKPDVSNAESKKKLGFIDLLIKESDVNNNFSKDEMKNEVTTMMIAGHDTTALAFTWFLYNIARHPEHQKLIADELNAVFSNSDRPCTAQDLTELKHLECCIKESLRIHPNVPAISRYLPEDTETGGYMLPKGAMVILSVIGMHHNPEVFPDPDDFKPERFLAENSIGRHPFAFSPFSAGPRNCIGQKFAMLELKVILANLIRRFIFSLADPEAPLIPAIQETMLAPKYPIKLVVSKRLAGKRMC